MITRIFRLQLDYLFLTEGTIFKKNTDGNYFILMSDDTWCQVGIDGNITVRDDMVKITIKGDKVESTPDIFEDITDIF